MTNLLNRKQAAEFLGVSFDVFRQSYSAALRKAKVVPESGHQSFVYFDRAKLEEAKLIMSKFTTHRDRVRAIENYFGA
jgi:hypothetical protein